MGCRVLRRGLPFNLYAQQPIVGPGTLAVLVLTMVLIVGIGTGQSQVARVIHSVDGTVQTSHKDVPLYA